MHTGFAIRMAQAMRLGQEFHARQSAREKEVRRRTFWACFVMDRLVAFSTGRPITLRLANIGARLPCPDQDFFFEEEEEAGLYLHDLVENGISRSRLHTLAFYIVAVHLWSSMTTLYVTGRRRIRVFPTSPQSPLTLRGEALQRWMGSLPSKFLWTPRNYHMHRSVGHGKLFVASHMLLRHCAVVAHQEYLPQYELLLDSTGDIDAAGLDLGFKDERLTSSCLSNTDDIRSICNSLSADDSEALEDMRSTFAALALISAANVHLWSKYASPDPSPDEQERHHNQVRMILDILHSWEIQWRMAQACSNTLDNICLLYEQAYVVDQHADLITVTPLTEQSHESEGEVEPHPLYRSHAGDGYPDAATMHQRLYDKIRMIMLGPLQSSETKQDLMRVFRDTMWEHTWTFEGVSLVDSMVHETLHDEEQPYSHETDC